MVNVTDFPATLEGFPLMRGNLKNKTDTSEEEKNGHKRGIAAYRQVCVCVCVRKQFLLYLRVML